MEIPQFYKDRSLFLTGVTGFMGKVLLEKILRCCPEVAKIYVLIRPKGGKMAEKRLAALLELPLFSKLREERPNFRNSVCAVEGDVLQSDLGLNNNNINHIIDEVSLVFHCAASVRFHEPLPDALESNVRSVDRVLNLVKRLKYFEALVHVSTSYAYCYRKHIDEVVYPVTEDISYLLHGSKWITRDMLEAMSPHMLLDHPNTYTYTKSLAENLVVASTQGMQKGRRLPVVIVRPSIVTSTWKEPIPGWCDSMNGPVGLIITFGKGLLRTMLGKRESVVNFIPVDIAVNVMIASGWKIVTERDSTLTIYNCTAQDANPMTWGQLSDYISANIKKLPLDTPARIPVYQSSISPNALRNKLEWIYCHWIPAYIYDFVLKVCGKKQRFVRWYEKVLFMSNSLKYFTMKSWKFENGNMLELQSSMSEKDKEVFYFDTTEINWEDHIADYHAGVKKHILHEDFANVPITRLWIRRRQFLSNLVSSILLFGILYFFSPDFGMSEYSVYIWIAIFSVIVLLQSFFSG